MAAVRPTHHITSHTYTHTQTYIHRYIHTNTLIYTHTHVHTNTYINKLHLKKNIIAFRPYDMDTKGWVLVSMSPLATNASDKTSNKMKMIK